MAKAYALDEEGMRRFQKMWKWMRNFTVTGAKSFRNTEDSCSILIGGAEESSTTRTKDASIWIRILGNTQDGSNKRWKYTWEQAYKGTGGYGGWAQYPNGYKGGNAGDTYGYAYNSVENVNGTSGNYGNGVTSTNLSGTLDIKPAPNNVVFRAWFVYPADGSSPEVWFSSYANGIDGGC